MKNPQRVKQPDISQSLWWYCCGTVKPGLAGHHSWCEREETDLQLATMGDPDMVGKAMVRAEECCPLWVSLDDFDTGLKSPLLQINRHSQSNFISLLSGGNDKYVFFSCWHGLPQCTSYKTRSVNCRHWLPAGDLMELGCQSCVLNTWHQITGGNNSSAMLSVQSWSSLLINRRWHGRRYLSTENHSSVFLSFSGGTKSCKHSVLSFSALAICNFEGSWEEILGYLAQGLYIYMYLYKTTYVLHI